MIAATVAATVIWTWMVPCAVVNKYVAEYGVEGAKALPGRYGVTVLGDMDRRIAQCARKREKN